MIARFVKDSIRRSPRRKAMVAGAIALGTAVATSMLGVMLSIGDRINLELRAAGANIVVTTKAAALTGGVGGITTGVAGAANELKEEFVPRIKQIFWALNITGFAPSLTVHDGSTTVEGAWFDHSYEVPGTGKQTAGLRALNPAWKVSGAWPNDDSDGCMAGAALARRSGWSTGSSISVLGGTCTLTGVVSTGDETDERLLMPLARVQALTSKAGKIDRIDVAALTKPEDDFARKNPKLMTSEEFERWNCTNYVTSIAHQIAEVIPDSDARPVRKVADSEGKVLSSISGLMGLITLAALISAGLTVWSLTATTVMERRGEIAIMQAIGGARWLVATLFGSEIALIGLAGGAIGTVAGVWLARFVGESVFHSAIDLPWILPFVILPGAVLVALAGAAQPLVRTLRLSPAIILREGV